MEPWLKPCSCAISLSFLFKAASFSFSFSLERLIFMLRMCVCTMSNDSGPPYMSSPALAPPLMPDVTRIVATATIASAEAPMIITRSGRVLLPPLDMSGVAASTSCTPKLDVSKGGMHTQVGREQGRKKSKD